VFGIIEIIVSLEKTFLAWDLLIVIDSFRDEKDKSCSIFINQKSQNRNNVTMKRAPLLM